MKRFFVYPLIIASLSMNVEIPQNDSEIATSNDTQIEETNEERQENTLTIYKSPDFISKWNDQFLEAQTEPLDKD